MLHTKTEHPSPPAAERAYAYLKERIIDGTVPGSTMLSEGEVAQELGCSRTPVREAFLRLEVEGFLQLYPKRGALVVPLTARDIREVYEARELVDRFSAEHICGLSDSERHVIGSVLEAIIAEQDEALAAEDLAEYTRLDAKFHQTIMDNGGNRFLSQLGHSLREQQQRFTATAVGRSPARARRFVDGHRQLTRALIDGDFEAYSRALSEHLTNSRNQL